MRILNLFGLGDTAFLFTEHMNEFGYDTHMLLSNRQFATQNPNWHRKYKNIKDKVHVWNCSDMMDPFTVRELGSFVNEFDIILAHSPAQVFSHIIKKPFYIWDGGSIREYMHPTKKYDVSVKNARQAYRKAKRIFTADIDTYYTFMRQLENREFVPLPVDLETFRPMKTIKSTDKFVIYFPSRQNEEHKGLIEILRGIAMFAENNDCEIWIAKYGKDFILTELYVEEFGIQDKVKFIPLQPKKQFAMMLNAADVVIDQIKLGSIGGIGVQAMACNKPVIVNANWDWYKEQYNELPSIAYAKNAEDVCRWFPFLFPQRLNLSKPVQFIRKFHDSRVVTRRILRSISQDFPTLCAQSAVC